MQPVGQYVNMSMLKRDPIVGPDLWGSRPDRKLKKKRGSVVRDQSWPETAETDEGLLDIRRNTPNKSQFVSVSDGPNRGNINVRKYLAKQHRKELTMLLQLGRNQRQSSTIINEMHSF